MLRKMAMLRKTFVWWDINSCPIPAGFDPCLVGRRIETALKKSGYSDPVTITAVGNLREGEGPGEDVLRKLSSSGIALNHATRPSLALSYWTCRNGSNPSSTTIMLVSHGPKELKLLAPLDEEYRILLAFHQRDPSSRWKSFLNNVRKEWLWKSLLSDDMDSGSADKKPKTTRLVLQDKYTETVESPWYCSVCRFACKSFEDFSTHLKSGKHGYWEWDSWANINNVVCTNPENFEWGRSKEWDLLNLEDMVHGHPDLYLAVKREWDLWASSKYVDRRNPDNFVWSRSKEGDQLNL